KAKRISPQAVLDQHRRPRLSFFRSLFNSQRTRQTTKVRRSGDQPGQPPFKHARSKLEKTRPTLTRGAKPSQPAIPSQISRKNTTANPTSRQTNQTASAVQPVRPGATAVVDERLIGRTRRGGQYKKFDHSGKSANPKPEQQLASSPDRQTVVTGASWDPRSVGCGCGPTCIRIPSLPSPTKHFCRRLSALTLRLIRCLLSDNLVTSGDIWRLRGWHGCRPRTGRKMRSRSSRITSRNPD
ncbi:hypothetical protein SAMN05216566_1231, partial [Aureimonas phyllosphaerae]